MKELLELYIVFFKLGIVNFGGGYAMLPLLQKDLVEKRKWATATEIADYYAIGQCTPGAIAVNVSTFIGEKKHGILGGIFATLGFITPAFIIIFIIAALLTNFSDNTYVQYALAGIRVAVFVLVVYAIVGLINKSITDIFGAILAILVAVLSIVISTDYVPLYAYVIFAGFYGFFINWIKQKRKIKKAVDSMDKEITADSKVVSEDKEKDKGRIQYIIGLVLGLILGIIAVPLAYIFKHKKFKEGVLTTFALWLIFLVCTIMTIILGGDYIYFKLYFQFFKIGICAFGGGLATVPFLKELGTSTGWFTSTDLANMIAVSESTPGAMGVNMSTYVGYTVLQNMFGNYAYSFIGSIISTMGLVSPSVIIVVIISKILNKFKNNKYVDWVFYGLRAASIGLIVCAAYSILEIAIFNDVGLFDSSVTSVVSVTSVATFFSSIAAYLDALINWKALAVGTIIGILVFKYKKHPILYIALAAVVGICLEM